MIEYKKARCQNDLLVDCRPDQVMIVHQSVSGAILCLKRDEFDAMNGRQIIKRFNEHIDWVLDSIATRRPLEIADGEPQLKWNKTCQQWTSGGDVLRCIVDWNSNGRGEHGLGELAIRIDDKLLSGQEFLDIIEVFEGSGMRLEFMHKNRLTNPPEPEIKVRQAIGSGKITSAPSRG